MEGNMNSLFYPKNLLVVGVSEKPDNLPRIIAENLIRFHYPGELYLIGRCKGNLDEHPILDSFETLPQGIDLAIILTPAATIPDLVEGCGKKGVRHVIVETGGFAETDEQGESLARQVLAIAQKYQMRLVGPNCIGILNPQNGICSVFVKMEPDEIPPGRVSLMAQSGAVTLSLVYMLAANNLGVSKAVSIGNKLDYRETDYLQYFLQDPDTDIILMHLEGISDGRKLLDLARDAQKPVMVYKSNTSQASAHAAHSHTAALTSDDRLVDAAFKQFGLSRIRSLRELALFAKGLSLPPMHGNRLAVFTRSGGHGIIATDLAHDFGFELPECPQELMENAKQYFRADIIDLSNPLDLGTVFNFDSYIPLVRQSIECMQPDGVMVIFVFPQDDYESAAKLVRGFQSLLEEYHLPIALCFSSTQENIDRLEKELRYPIFVEVADAMRALAASRDISQFHKKTRARAALRSTQRCSPVGAAGRARQILASSLGNVLLTHEAFLVCEAYEIPVPPWGLAKDADEAERIALKIGYPLAIKLITPGVIHKSDIGGVMLDIVDEESLNLAIETLKTRLRAQGIDEKADFLLQKMVKDGREVIVGGKKDNTFGPVILFGLGGIYVEVLNDVALRVAPIDETEAMEMTTEIQSSRLLDGVRGEAPSDREALVDTLVRISELLTDLPEITELDINPLIVCKQGVQVVDARIARLS